jgi:hypothetical protein
MALEAAMTGDPEWQQFLETEAHVHCVRIGEHRLRVIEVGAGEPALLVQQAQPQRFNGTVVRFLRGEGE